MVQSAIGQDYASRQPDFAERLGKLTQRQPLTPDMAPAAVILRGQRATEVEGAVTPLGLERQFGMEALLGNNDALDVAYLEQGMLAARAVGLISVEAGEVGGRQRPGGKATGFLVGPGLLLTNHHVLEDPDDARRATLSLGYAYDRLGNLGVPQVFRLTPEAGFWTSVALDYALVVVAQRTERGSERGAALADSGFLRLNPRPGKTDRGLHVSVIGHPAGKPKQVALRENRVLQVGEGQDAQQEAPAVPNADALLWYETDTLPGSSGSPVFNDLWQVVALHHAGVPRTRTEEGQRLYLRAGHDAADPAGWLAEDLARDLSDERLTWIANEGVRISRICDDLRAMQTAAPHPVLRAWLDDQDGTAPYPAPVAPAVPAAGPVILELGQQRRPEPVAADYASRAGNGYQPDFLGPVIPLPDSRRAEAVFGPAAQRLDGAGSLLEYRHFSVVMCAQRRLAYFTAVNIDGASVVDLPRGRDVWQYDPRLDRSHQVGDELYANEPGGNYFDRGHLVRRRDPTWGPDAQQANDDTFHWTNCSPQYWQFNESDTLWAGLENFVLLNADTDNLRVSVMNGPVFGAGDTLHRGIQIPKFYWKLVAVLGAAGRLNTSAYVVSQEQQATSIGFEALPVGPYRTFQVSVTELERRTLLDFGETVRAADVGAGLAERPLRSVHDLRRPRRGGAAARPQDQLAFRTVPVPGSAPLMTRFRLETGGELLIETRGDEQESSAVVDGGIRTELARPELSGGETVQDAAQSFEQALQGAAPALQSVADFLKTIDNPDEISVQVGLKLSAQAGIILAHVGAEGTLNVTMKWTKH
ncbi:CU044_2847 family protein [Deinococcus sp.]|uniref:CU044_2847 family protein n=1 Tax=Deinococcus sp. TaxID=47478 RepID=UPI003C7BACC7